jgi:hypothetical protein
VWWKPWTWARLVGSETRIESEFDIEQVDLLLAIREFNSERDSNGFPFSEVLSPAANPNEHSLPEVIRFFAQGPFTNWAEKSRLDAEQQYKKDAGDAANLNGMFWTVEKKTYGANGESS